MGAGLRQTRSQPKPDPRSLCSDPLHTPLFVIGITGVWLYALFTLWGLRYASLVLAMVYPAIWTMLEACRLLYRVK